MISQLDKQELSLTLGKNYSAAILLFLKSKEIVNPSTREPYSDSFIRQVMNGNKENVDIELSIWELYEQRQKDIARIAAIKKSTQPSHP